jgi:hypothetical protein
MNWKAIIGISVGAGLGYYLYRYITVQTALLNQYETKLAGIDVNTATVDLVSLNIRMVLINKSKIEAKIDHVYGDVFLRGVQVGSFNETDTFILPAQGQSIIPITFSFSPKVLLQNVVDFVLNAVKQQDLPIQIKGFVSIHSGFVSIGLPFTYDTSIKNYLAG